MHLYLNKGAGFGGKSVFILSTLNSALLYAGNAWASSLCIELYISPLHAGKHPLQCHMVHAVSVKAQGWKQDHHIEGVLQASLITTPIYGRG